LYSTLFYAADDSFHLKIIGLSGLLVIWKCRQRKHIPTPFNIQANCSWCSNNRH